MDVYKRIDCRVFFLNTDFKQDFNTALELLDAVCSSNLVTKGFFCCVVTIKSIQSSLLVVIFYIYVQLYRLTYIAD